MEQATSIDPRIVAGSDYGVSDREWTRIDWRDHLGQVKLPGASVNYVEIGEGDPLLFVHGVSGSWQNWLENLPHFAAVGRRCVALDLPGFGASPLPDWPIGMEAYGRLVQEFCEQLGLGGATLVGNSMGGLVAVELALAAPEAFERLVLVSAAGIINTWRPEERAIATAWAWRHFSPLFADRAHQIVTRPRLRRAVFGPFVRFPGRLDDDVLIEQIVNGLHRADGFEPALADLIRTDFREGLARIAMPTMIVWGLSDRVIPVAAAASYHRRIPGSHLEIFERTGHVPQLERPLRFNALLDEFLA
ncbi:MAG: alpha/beta fold hydrolase [Actinobacteria bacterium]|nr:alpha/beta fold hydrolase [Actinomycetota bacterium]